MTYNRYNNIKTRKNNRNKRIYNSVILPKITRSEDDIYIYATKGDRLDLIAYDYYDDPALWPVIAKANNIGKGTLWIDSDKQIRIPFSPEQFIEKMKSENSNR